MEKQTIDANQRIKANIQQLVEVNQLKSARQLLAQYVEIAPSDTDIFSMQAVIEMQEGNLDKAIIVLQKGLKVIPGNFDLLYNLACAYEMQEDYCRTYDLLQQLKQVPQDDDMKNLVVALQKRIESKYPTEPESKAKIIFFVKPQMDSFLEDIIDSLKSDYNVKKCIVTDAKQIDEGMVWADICWFEWCDEIVIYGSQLDVAKRKKMLCRLHSYEAFTEYPKQVKWENIDKVIFVAEHIRQFVLENVPALKKKQTMVIPNGVDIEKYTYKERKPGFNIAYVGYINYKKGPMLLLHAFKAIYDKDNRYKLFIAGKFQDPRDALYFKQMIKKWKLENNVIFQGWQEDLNSWLEDKHYILCTSLLESQNMSVMQAMAKGIKPLIHNFVGAENIYDSKWIWNSIEECKQLLLRPQYVSQEYRDFVKTFSMEVVQKEIIKLVRGEEKPLVSIGIMNYNYEHYLDDCITSILGQTYTNIEVIIIDDFSTDNSRKKIEEYIQRNEHISAVFHEKNSGTIALAMKEIPRLAKGEYVMFLSADDYLAEETAVEKFVESIFHENCDYVYSDLLIVNADKIAQSRWSYKKFTNDEIVYQTFHRYGSGIIPMTAGIYKTDYLNRHGNWWIEDKRNLVAGDTLNTLIHSQNNWTQSYLSEALIAYRQHGNNMTYSLEKRIVSLLSILEYITGTFSEKVYFPDVLWGKFSFKEKCCHKNFLLGKYYYSMWEQYSSGAWKPFGNGKEERIENLLSKTKEIAETSKKYLLLYRKAGMTNQETEDMLLAFENSYKTKRKSLELDRRDIVHQGQKMNFVLQQEYADKFVKEKYKALILSPDNGAWLYAFQSWRQCLQHMGIEADICFDVKDVPYDEKYILFISIADDFYLNLIESYAWISRIPFRIGIPSAATFSGGEEQQELNLIEKLKYSKIFNHFCSPFNDNGNERLLRRWVAAKIPILSVPYGFNPLIHYPVAPQLELEKSFFFVGSNSRLKQKDTEEYLIPILKRFEGNLFGTGWGNKVFEYPMETIREQYASAKISLNYHLNLQKQVNCEVNERTFIICACGGFQLVDNPKAMYALYNGNEIAIAKDPEEYKDMFEYYLGEELLRNEIAYNGMLRTYRSNYSLFSHLEEMIKKIILADCKMKLNT